MNLESRILSSMEKVFPTKDPRPLTVPMTTLCSEAYSFQAAYRPDSSYIFAMKARIDVDSSLPLTVKKVSYVPGRMLYVTNADTHFLTDQPGLFPDPLYEAMTPARSCGVTEEVYAARHPEDHAADKDDCFFLTAGQWNAFLIEVRPKTNTRPGRYPITITLSVRGPRQEDPDMTVTDTVFLEVIGAELPKQKLRYTCWFHGDCIADYYGMKVFSEEHWKAMENTIRLAADYGQNMLLVPVFTPPLDTAVGGERTTIQLVEVARNCGRYSFDFSKVTRFLKMAQDAGIEYFEISHLFTQWGGRFCPKIMAEVDGTYRQIFGWDQEALCKEYQEFLSAFLPAFVRYLNENDLAGRVYFHLTDEPSGEHLSQYLKLKDFVTPLLGGYPIMDAMSEYEYFRQGVCACPVVATTALEPFLSGTRPQEFWVYYCVAQGRDNLSNRFLAMPGYRTRILGVQLYMENCAGFLQWGLNFYNSAQSVCHIDPYADTDAAGTLPAGDPFIVYPGPDGSARASQRLVIFHEALQDLRALQLLESLTSREHVLALIQEGVQEPITFTCYPTGEDYLLKLREKVNFDIKNHLSDPFVSTCTGPYTKKA